MQIKKKGREGGKKKKKKKNHSDKSLIISLFADSITGAQGNGLH